MTKLFKRAGLVAAAGAMLALLFVSLFRSAPMGPIHAGVITPVAQTARGSEPARVAEFFKDKTITSDTRACFDLANYEVADIQYDIDQNDAFTNVVTLSVQNSNDNATFNSANTIVNANAADANGIGQYPLFGRYNCVLADVTGTHGITLSVIGVAK